MSEEHKLQVKLEVEEQPITRIYITTGTLLHNGTSTLTLSN